MTTANHHPRRRALLAVITVVGTLLVTAGPVGAAGTTRSHTVEPDLQQDAKIQPALRTELEKEDVADFWVLLKEKADLGAASGIADWDARGRAVVRELKQTARASQAEVAARLTAAGVEHQAFWAANAIRVTDGSLDLAHDLVAEPQVAALRVLRSYGPVEPVRRAARAAADTVEWGVANIRADQVWRDLGVDGEGIVIANIDTGVQFDHPALASQYRGYDGAGGYDHDYNWLDTSADCPTAAPCDNQGHGTHTMGTMVGSDGGANEIGVAPGATWIAANGCATCSDEDLLEAGQWMLAPTRVDGTDADPSMRPDIVNNSWGTNEPTNDPLLEEVSQAWTASGIFGVWANGNLGPGCRTSGSPGSRTINYSVGAYGPDNLIANFSSRGDGQGGDIKPDIAAPGVDVRSAFPGGGYGLGSGTSMATPHVSGAIALLWSGNPSLIGDIDATRSLLDATAIDSNDLQCGGEPGNNNVFGEGRLDALALVEVGSRGLGDLAGTVTDAVTGRPLAGVTVQATSGAATRTEMTGADGTYARQLAPGDYTVSVRLHGYVAQTSTITIERDQSVTEDFALAPAQRVVLSGRVTDGAAGWPLAASLTASDRGGDSVTAATDPVTGAYALDLLPGETYSIKVQAGVPGYAVETASVAVAESDLVRNLGMSADLLACTAPGYRSRHGAGMREAFRTPRLPRGWRVRNRDVDLPYYENGPGWRFIEPGRRQNRTGGRGGMAIVDSERAGPHHVQDTFLVTRPVDLGRARTPVVEFSSDLEPAVNSTAVVQVSTNGRTWKTVWRRGGATAEAVGSQVVAVPQLAGRREASVRFRYVGSWSRWWAVDDVFIGNRTCQRSDAPPPA